MARVDKDHFVALAIFIVVAEIFFYDHIVGRASVTWDFVTDYHPPTAYIIENLKHGSGHHGWRVSRSGFRST